MQLMQCMNNPFIGNFSIFLQNYIAHYLTWEQKTNYFLFFTLVTWFPLGYRGDRCFFVSL